MRRKKEKKQCSNVLRRAGILSAAGLLAGLCLVISPVPAFAEETAEEAAGEPAAYAEEEYSIDGLLIAKHWVIMDGRPLTDYQHPGVTFDHATRTLILNNANIEVDNNDFGSSLIPAIQVNSKSSADELTVRLIGESTISYKQPMIEEDCDAGLMRFHNFSKVTFTGGGTLNLDCDGNVYAGIQLIPGSYDYCGGNGLVIDGCTINIDASNCQGGTREASLGIFHGIDEVESITLNSAELNITAQENADLATFNGIVLRSYRVTEPQTVTVQNSRLNIVGPPNGTDSTAKGMCLWNGNLNADHSEINIDLRGNTSATAIACYDSGGSHIPGSGKVTVNGSEITLQTENNDSTSAIWAEEGLTDTGNSIYMAGDTMDTLKEISRSDLFSKYTPQLCSYSAVKITPGSSVLKGDVNQDGVINLSDLMLCMNHATDSITLTGDQFTAADMDSNGDVNLSDLMALMNQVM